MQTKPIEEKDKKDVNLKDSKDQMNKLESSNQKPKLRGIIHGAAFLCTVISTIAFVVISLFIYRSISNQDELPDIKNKGVSIYLFSQLLQYGISSFYHYFNWSPRITRVLQHLDHMCIFVLISGTQTSVLLNGVSSEINVMKVITLSWTISIIGILKILVMNRLHNIFDLIVYIVHGLLVVPFYGIIKKLSTLDKTMAVLGGIFYITGGIVYGLERPDFWPETFGFHEVFHLFTVIANSCFAVVVFRPYLFSLIEYFSR